jgi:hypothetical protein
MEDKQLALLKSNTLIDLAARIRAEHELVIALMQQSLERAMAVGDLLIEAKVQVKEHGELWLPWIRDHCQLSERTVQQYMRLAKNRAFIQSKLADAANMSIAAAVQLLAPPKDGDEELAQSIDVDEVQLLASPEGEVDVDIADIDSNFTPPKGEELIEALLQLHIYNCRQAISLTPCDCRNLAGHVTEEAIMETQNAADAWAQAVVTMRSLKKKGDQDN